MEEQNEIISTEFEVGDYVVCQNIDYNCGGDTESRRIRYGLMFRIINIFDNGKQIRLENPRMDVVLFGAYPSVYFRKVNMKVASHGCFVWEVPPLFKEGDIVLWRNVTPMSNERLVVLVPDCRNGVLGVCDLMPIVLVKRLSDGKILERRESAFIKETF
jgi:hypothetical protein